MDTDMEEKEEKEIIKTKKIVKIIEDLCKAISNAKGYQACLSNLKEFIKQDNDEGGTLWEYIQNVFNKYNKQNNNEKKIKFQLYHKRLLMRNKKQHKKSTKFKPKSSQYCTYEQLKEKLQKQRIDTKNGKATLTILFVLVDIQIPNQTAMHTRAILFMCNKLLPGHMLPIIFDAKKFSYAKDKNRVQSFLQQTFGNILQEDESLRNTIIDNVIFLNEDVNQQVIIKNSGTNYNSSNMMCLVWILLAFQSIDKHRLQIQVLWKNNNENWKMNQQAQKMQISYGVNSFINVYWKQKIDSIINDPTVPIQIG